MQKDVFGLIYAGEENINLRELINERSVSALPVGGRYRVIDFMLSNMVNSGIRNVGVITRKNYQSLMDHVGSGKEWDLSRKNDGLFILPPFDTFENAGNHQGLVDTIKGAGSYLHRVPQQYCLLTGSFTIFNGVFDDMFRQHLETGADITILYNVEDELSAAPAVKFRDVRLETNEEGRVVDMQYKANLSKCTKVSMDAYLIKKDLLEFLVDDAMAHNKYDLVTDVIMQNLDRLKIYGYEHKGYVARMNSVASYYKINMDFLKPEVQKDLFFTGRNIYTKSKDEAPTKYGTEAQVKNSLVASGCVIEGEVENSILFRGVYVAKGTKIKNSIIMQDSQIYENASLDKVILDKRVNIRPYTNLVGNKSYPVIIPKGAIV